MDCDKATDEPGKTGGLVHMALLAGGLASGVALTVLLSVVAYYAQGHNRALVLILIVGNLFVMVPWHLRTMPQWFDAGLAIARGFHWIVNLIFASLGLLLLSHAGQPKRALAFGTLALMFVLWARTARWLTYRGSATDLELATPEA